MLINSTIAFFHFIAALAVVSTLVFEKLTFSQDLSVREARRIQKSDAIYGLSCVLVILFGFIRVYYFEKGSEYYFTNTFFWLKIAFFSITGILSIYPTVRFLKWKNQLSDNKPPIIPDREYLLVKKLINFEIIALILAIFCASMMAKGIDI